MSSQLLTPIYLKRGIQDLQICPPISLFSLCSDAWLIIMHILSKNLLARTLHRSRQRPKRQGREREGRRASDQGLVSESRELRRHSSYSERLLETSAVQDTDMTCKINLQLSDRLSFLLEKIILLFIIISISKPHFLLLNQYFSA